jgi:hypothetical protein
MNREVLSLTERQALDQLAPWRGTSGAFSGALAEGVICSGGSYCFRGTVRLIPNGCNRRGGLNLYP